MPDPDDDVELPPSYDFSGGLTGFDAPVTPPPAPAPTPLPTPTPPPTPPPSVAPPSTVPLHGSTLQGSALWGSAGARSTPTQAYGQPPVAGTTGYATGSTPRGVTPPGGTGGYGGYAGGQQPQRPARKRGGLVGTVVGVLVVGGVVIGTNASRSDSDSGFGGSGGSGANPTPVQTLPDGSTRVWTTSLDYDELLVSRPLEGPRTRFAPEGSLALVGDSVVGRFGDDPWDETEPVTVRALSLTDGRSRDLVTMDRPRCAVVPGADAAPPALLTCAGTLEGDDVVVTLDVATGEEVRRFDSPGDVAVISATETGVFLIEVDPDSGDSALHWYTPDGDRSWSEDVGDLPADTTEYLVEEYDGVWELGYSADVVPVGDGVLLISSSSVVAMDSSGVSFAGTCYGGAVLPEAYVCEDDAAGATQARTASGEVLWSVEDLMLTTRLWDRSPTPVAVDYVDRDGDYVPEHRAVDPATGALGEPLDTGDGYVQVSGTSEIPLLVEQPEVDDYDAPVTLTVSRLDPATQQVVWETQVESRQYPSVVTTADRVLVGVASDSWTVLDAATGEVVGGMTAEGAVTTIVEGGVVLESLYEIQRVTTP